MYAVAFRYWPTGAYENQENGSGLLALLEKYQLSAPELSSTNQNYLNENPRGWMQRFKNTDDAITYQPIWLNNAYFQYLYTGQVNQENLKKSFEWLLLQAPPGGETLQYNHPKATQLAGAAYLGAVLLNDPRYIWLAGKAIQKQEKDGGFLEAQPGIETPLLLQGTAPTSGSCIIYSEAGLPNQLGPLTVDKLILRQNWTDDAAYVLVNLRSSGWHRYKSANSITVYQHGDRVVTEKLEDVSIVWLPAGRSQFRDKRIPRQNLNGLSIQRSGLSEALFLLSNMGSKWEQDPPNYSELVRFENEADESLAEIRLRDWHGWNQERVLYLGENVLVVADRTRGPVDGVGELTWHIQGGANSTGNEILTTNNTHEEKVVFLSSTESTPKVIYSATNDGQPLAEVSVPVTGGETISVAVFLSDNWYNAQAVILDTDKGSILSLRVDNKIKEIPLFLK